jgi:thymidylate synthase
MIVEEWNYVENYSIEGAWREALLLTAKKGYAYVVERGSYVGQIRKQLEHLTIVIKEPWIRPLAPIMPLGIPPVTTDDKIDQYFVEYLMDTQLAENELYRYSTFIVPQLPYVIEALNESNGNSNQACITVGNEYSLSLLHAPCLKIVDFKVVGGVLWMTVYFRSWDGFVGFPENIGGLQLLKEYVLSNLEFPCVDGPIVAYSNGFHIYSQYFEIVNILNIGVKL